MKRVSHTVTGRGLTEALFIIFITLAATYSHWVLDHIPVYRHLHAHFAWYFVELIDKGVVLSIIVGALLVLGRRHVFRELMLGAPILPAAAFALICVIPMALGFMLTRKFSPESNLFGLLFMDLLSPFVEEVHVRGFGFWQLRFRLHWPFVAAMVPQAILTGLGHIDKGETVMQVVGIFALMFSGAILFSWLLDRWRSLWFPLFLHAMMNGVWDLYSVSNTVLGGWFPFAVQQVTVLLAVCITLYFQRKANCQRRRNRFGWQASEVLRKGELLSADSAMVQVSHLRSFVMSAGSSTCTIISFKGDSTKKASPVETTIRSSDGTRYTFCPPFPESMIVSMRR